jgi:flavin-dependent dehydrogenase
LGPLQTTSDFSYSNRRLVGPRLARVGDAAGFMDPIFSAGVFLAMWSGFLAAELMQEGLEQGTDARSLLGSYERRVRRAMRFYWHMIEAYYTQPFMELFLQPREWLDLPGAVNDVLAGNLEPRWSIRWRLQVFYTLVRIQKYWPVVPRLCFDPAVPSTAGSASARQP